MAFLSLKTKTVGSDSLSVRIFSWFVLLFLVFTTGFFFLRFVKAEPIEAESGTQKWKNFSENRFGFAMDYPSNWGIDHAYDRYAAGMLNIDLNNKKNGWNSECGPGYVDLRIFVGSEPGIGTKDSGADLKSQLYREIEMIKNSGNAELVENMNIEGKNAFKIKSDAPTLSLNGRCPGPLYLVDRSGKSFVYIFAGTGSDAKEIGEKIVRQIISSIKTD
jgi:hypothetical protein